MRLLLQISRALFAVCAVLGCSGSTSLNAPSTDAGHSQLDAASTDAPMDAPSTDAGLSQLDAASVDVLLDAPVTDASLPSSDAASTDAPMDAPITDASLPPSDAASVDARLDAPATDVSLSPSDARSMVRRCFGWEPTATGLRVADLDRYGEAGMTEINVLFCNPLMLEPRNELVFFVQVTNHFGIPRSDFTLSTWAETNSLRTDGGVAWVGEDLTIEEHHAVGLLTVSRAAGGGELLGPEAGYLVLHLNGIGSRPEVVFRWERAFLR